MLAKAWHRHILIPALSHFCFIFYNFPILLLVSWLWTNEWQRANEPTTRQVECDCSSQKSTFAKIAKKKLTALQRLSAVLLLLVFADRWKGVNIKYLQLYVQMNFFSFSVANYRLFDSSSNQKEMPSFWGWLHTVFKPPPFPVVLLVILYFLPVRYWPPAELALCALLFLLFWFVSNNELNFTRQQQQKVSRNNMWSNRWFLCCNQRRSFQTIELDSGCSKIE